MTSDVFSWLFISTIVVIRFLFVNHTMRKCYSKRTSTSIQTSNEFSDGETSCSWTLKTMSRENFIQPNGLLLNTFERRLKRIFLCNDSDKHCTAFLIFAPSTRGGLDLLTCCVPPYNRALFKLSMFCTFHRDRSSWRMTRSDSVRRWFQDNCSTCSCRTDPGSNHRDTLDTWSWTKPCCLWCTWRNIPGNTALKYTMNERHVHYRSSQWTATCNSQSFSPRKPWKAHLTVTTVAAAHHSIYVNTVVTVRFDSDTKPLLLSSLQRFNVIVLASGRASGL